MKRLIFTAILLVGLLMSANAATWEKKTAAVMTPWGEQLTSENVWAEYPRPSMKRDDWMNLNGVWDYYKRSGINYDYEDNDRRFDKAILVPFPVESALSGIMDNDYKGNTKATHMYRRTFEVPASFAGKNVILHFGAVDWRCTVYVNGKEAGSHDGGSDPFKFDITELLNESGEQELQVAVWDPTNAGGQPHGKQNNSPSGIWYTPSSGIWQTVWMEPVAKAHITSYEPIPNIDNGTVDIKINATDADAIANIVVKYAGTQVAQASGKVGEFMTISIPDAKLWSPDEPNLYDIEVTLQKDGQDVDAVGGYFGMRKFSRAMAFGKPCLLLNNKPLYMYGPLDQGWWPDGLLTPPSYEAMIYDLEVIKAMGMNMVRKHIKVENDLWYDWCNRNGLVVWQDMVNVAGNGLVGNKSVCQQHFYDENEDVINALRHHPSIGAWVVYNEGWGQDTDSDMEHTHKGITLVEEQNHDPGRFVHAVTGWTDVERGDFIDVHSYPAPGAAENLFNERIASCGEFGGINLFIDGHMWAGSDVNYTTVADAETYTNLYDSYTDKLQSLQKDKGLWMSVYTQITDVEQECNGILTYDRKINKLNDAQFQRLKTNIQKTIYNRFIGSETVVQAADENANIEWSYTTETPADNWFETAFDASSWSKGKAGFGNRSSWRTAWSSTDIWIRRTFTIENVKPEEVSDLRLWMFHDDDTEVYINGKLATKLTGWIDNYAEFSIMPEALASIKIDGTENTIAIHCKQDHGGQYIDCGIKMRKYVDNNELEVAELPARTPQPKFTQAEGKAYIMAYTTGNRDQLHYAYSYDGATWKTINGNRPVFSYESGIKSPFVRKIDKDGTAEYHMVAERTDGQSGFLHWTSTDLITWMPHAETSPAVDLNATALNYMIAPEIIYEENTDNYYIYYTAMVDGKSCIALCSTRNMSRFNTRQYFDPGFSADNIHIEKMGGKYYAFFYNQDRNLCVANSSDLRTTVEKFGNVQRMFGGSLLRVDAAQSFPALDNSGWFLYYQRKDGFGVNMSSSGNAAENKWYDVDKSVVTLPEGLGKSSVVIVTAEELQSILRMFGNEEFELLSTAEVAPETWKYTTSKQSAGSWTKVNYKETGWQDGLSGFGAQSPPNSVINTQWTSSEIYLRHQLDLTGMTREQIDAIEARIYYDEDVVVYFNEVEAFSATGYLTNYENVKLNQAAIDALTPDANNVVAIKCINKGGGQYIDFGLTSVRPDPTGIVSPEMSGQVSDAKKGIYNLQGQRLAETTRGINIVDGKKVVVE